MKNERSTVLIVDDSSVDRRLIAGLLEKEGDLEIEYATDGLQALKHLQESPPDLVLTDLNMPNMDGLQLVRNIRIHHTDIPVILMTAHGSEAIAIEALRAGAASYVPKLQMSDALCGTIAQVLSIAAANRTSTVLLDTLSETEFSFELSNDSELIDPLVRLVQQLCRGVGLCDETQRMQMGVALEHALLNALYRGNLELSAEDIDAARESQLCGNNANKVSERAAQTPFCDRKIYIDISISKDAAQFTVRDEGPGFDVGKLSDPSDESVADANQGRGILLMRALMDEVDYNEKGNQIVLVKRHENGR